MRERERDREREREIFTNIRPHMHNVILLYAYIKYILF